MTDEPMQGAMSINTKNLSADSRQPVNGTVEPIVFMIRSDVQTMLRREKEKASVSSIYLDLKPPYASGSYNEAISGGVCYFTVPEV